MTFNLVLLEGHRRAEREAACGGEDPVEVIAAYAQDNLIYTPDNRIAPVDAAAYAATPMNDRVNKFGQAYRSGAPILLHQTLADIVVDAAIDLKNAQGWSLRVYDGLRTIDAGTLMFANADPKWLQAGLLAKPGNSAHNRGLAVDSSIVDGKGCEIERFDHLDMESNHRDYAGGKVSAFQKEARLTKERAFQRAALKSGTIIAPLLSEYWDDRPPGSEADLWRVMASIRRIIGEKPQTEAEHAKDYPRFAAQWDALDKARLMQAFGSVGLTPPPSENILFHERLANIHDRDLPEHLRIVREGGLLPR